MKVYGIFEQVGSEYYTCALRYISTDYEKIKNIYSKMEVHKGELHNYKILASTDISEIKQCCYYESERDLEGWEIMESFKL